MEVVSQEEATICRRNGGRCGLCFEDPYSDRCVRWQEEIGAALTDDERDIYVCWRFERFVNRIKDKLRSIFGK